MSLTRSGYITGETQEIKKELTVRAVVNTEFGFPPPPFKVFRKAKSGLCVPRFYGEDKFGPPIEDRRPEPVKISKDVISINSELNKTEFNISIFSSSSFPNSQYGVFRIFGIELITSRKLLLGEILGPISIAVFLFNSSFIEYFLDQTTSNLTS